MGFNIEIVATDVPVIYWDDLTPEEIAENGYEDCNDQLFFRHGSYVFTFDDFTRTSTLEDWDGSHAMSYDSGFLVKYHGDDHTVTIGYFTG
jgi:hypothetical protein